MFFKLNVNWRQVLSLSFTHFYKEYRYPFLKQSGNDKPAMTPRATFRMASQSAEASQSTLRMQNRTQNIQQFAATHLFVVIRSEATDVECLVVVVVIRFNAVDRRTHIETQSFRV